MAPDPVARLIATLSRFAPLPEAERAWLHAHLTPRRFAPGALLIRAGDPPGEYHFVVQGLLRVSWPDAQGRARVRCFACEGEMSGPLTAWLAGEPSPLEVVAVEAAKTLALPAAMVPVLLVRHEGWRAILHGYMAELARRGEQRTLELLTLPPEQRYRRFMEQEGPLHARLPLHLTAAYLGISQVSLSRIRRRLGINQVNDPRPRGG